MPAVDVEDLAGVIQCLGVIGDVEMPGRLVGLAVTEHVESVAGVMLAECIDYGTPRPGGRAQGMQHHQRVASALFDKVHVAFAGGDGVGKVAPHEHDRGLLRVCGRTELELAPELTRRFPQC